MSYRATKQIAAEVDMHAEVLPALGQRLDLVLHRIGQCGKPHAAQAAG